MTRASASPQPPDDVVCARRDLQAAVEEAPAAPAGAEPVAGAVVARVQKPEALRHEPRVQQAVPEPVDRVRDSRRRVGGALGRDQQVAQRADRQISELNLRSPVAGDSAVDPRPVGVRRAARRDDEAIGVPAVGKVEATARVGRGRHHRVRCTVWSVGAHQVDLRTEDRVPVCVHDAPGDDHQAALRRRVTGEGRAAGSEQDCERSSGASEREPRHRSSVPPLTGRDGRAPRSSELRGGSAALLTCARSRGGTATRSGSMRRELHRLRVSIGAALSATATRPRARRAARAWPLRRADKGPGAKCGGKVRPGVAVNRARRRFS